MKKITFDGFVFKDNDTMKVLINHVVNGVITFHGSSVFDPHYYEYAGKHYSDLYDLINTLEK